MVIGQKVKNYYDRFRDIDVTFTKEVIYVTGLLAKQVHLKCGNDIWPCALFSSSFSGAKVMVNVKTGLLDKLKAVNNTVSLRYCFKLKEKGSPITFFVASRVTGYAPYRGSDEILLLSLQFTNRPPDYLIDIMGRLLDANVNFAKRKEEQISLTDENVRKLKLVSRDSSASIQDAPRRCFLQEVSFVSAKLVMLGVPKYLLDKEAVVRFDFEDESFAIKGKFTSVEYVPNKKEMVRLTLSYNEEAIPMSYKVRVNDFLVAIRADNRPQSDESKGAVKKKT